MVEAGHQRLKGACGNSGGPSAEATSGPHGATTTDTCAGRAGPLDITCIKNHLHTVFFRCLVHLSGQPSPSTNDRNVPTSRPVAYTFRHSAIMSYIVMFNYSRTALPSAWFDGVSQCHYYSKQLAPRTASQTQCVHARDLTYQLRTATYIASLMQVLAAMIPSDPAFLLRKRRAHT